MADDISGMTSRINFLEDEVNRHLPYLPDDFTDYGCTGGTLSGLLPTPSKPVRSPYGYSVRSSSEISPFFSA
ncbi:MAG: hypothetical protein SF029_10135 [bacterium]|nr:hypothetical protein [bacterium]